VSTSERDLQEGKAMQKAPVGIAIAGAVLLVVGVIMIPAPGPGLPIAAVGLVLLLVWAVLAFTAARSERRPEA
jgi:uncharacterized RDD family membrane protein YckC